MSDKNYVFSEGLLYSFEKNEDFEEDSKKFSIED